MASCAVYWGCSDEVPRVRHRGRQHLDERGSSRHSEAAHRLLPEAWEATGEVVDYQEAPDMSFKDADVVVMCKTCGYETTVMAWGKKKSPEHPLGGYMCLCHWDDSVFRALKTIRVIGGLTLAEREAT